MDQFESVLAVGALFGAGLWFLLDGRALRAVIGVILLSNATNLFLLMSSGDPSGRAPPILGPANVDPVDPLPQALILTAIVIGFGVLAFLVVLLARNVEDERHPPESSHGG